MVNVVKIQAKAILKCCFITRLKEFISKSFSALMRDRDELAAALEVRDRIKYDLSTPEREEILSTGDLIIEVSNLMLELLVSIYNEW